MTYDYNDASQVTSTHYSPIYNAGNLGLPARDIATDYTTGGLWAQDTTDGGDTVIGKADYNWHNQPIGLESQDPERPTGTRGPATGVQLAGCHRLSQHPRRQDREETDPTTWLSLDYAYDAGGNIRNVDGRAHKPSRHRRHRHQPSGDPGRWLVLHLRRVEPARHRQDRRS